MIKNLTLLFAVCAFVACGDKADEAPTDTPGAPDARAPAKTDDDDGGAKAAMKTVTLQIDGMT